MKPASCIVSLGDGFGVELSSGSSINVQDAAGDNNYQVTCRNGVEEVQYIPLPKPKRGELA